MVRPYFNPIFVRGGGGHFEPIVCLLAFWNPIAFELGTYSKITIPEDVINATSSSFIGPLYGPEYAWKGGSHDNTGFFHSTYEHNPWLLIQIPLSRLYSVTIINRKDCCGERLVNLEVRAGVSPGLTNEVVGRFAGPGFTGGVHLIKFDRVVMVQYLSFQIMGNGNLQVNGIRVNQKM